MRRTRHLTVSAAFGAALLSIGMGATAAGAAQLAAPQKAAPQAAAHQKVALHWGSFFGGHTGPDQGDVDTLLSPASMTLPGPVVQVATSNSTEYALLADGTVYAWGLGGDGQLGDGASADSFDTAVQVQFPAGVTIKSLPTDAMPYNTAMAIDTAGNAWGWGHNAGGQLCLGSPGRQLTPVELPFTDVTLAAGAGDHALYDANGTVYACGANGNGDLGDGTTVRSATPVKVHGLAGRHLRARSRRTVTRAPCSTTVPTSTGATTRKDSWATARSGWIPRSRWR